MCSNPGPHQNKGVEERKYHYGTNIILTLYKEMGDED